MAGNPTMESVIQQVHDLNEQIVAKARTGGQEALQTYRTLLENVAEAEEAAGDRTADWVQALARAQASFTRELAEAFPSALQRVGDRLSAVAGSAAEQARRVPGVATGEGAVKGAAATGDDLPIPNYDGLTVEEIVPRLNGLSAVDLGKVDAYERRTRNRKTVLDRIESVRS
jgi:hypothetical protein